eukprot:TRINITY_DN2392_c0_g1_i2.p1 TRINITY_DN2392_c0_g1~~TRINITY_DN2392_c0_g1_i2.p1  ORF type:complete len:123 (+),score=29.80 TRINITY_DN2392_c0_g1_i2:39-407(+)
MDEKSEEKLKQKEITQYLTPKKVGYLESMTAALVNEEGLFSPLKRRFSSGNKKRKRTPLREIRGSSPLRSPKRRKVGKPSLNLAQTYLDFGDDDGWKITCPDCGMMYRLDNFFTNIFGLLFK